MRSIFLQAEFGQCRVPHHHRGKSVAFSSSHQFAVDVNKTSPGKLLFWKKCWASVFLFLVFNWPARNPLPTSWFVMSFLIEDSAIWFSSCPFALKTYYSLHSFCIFWSVFNFFFFFALSHIASFPLCFMLCWKKTNKPSQKSSFIPWISSLDWKIQ